MFSPIFFPYKFAFELFVHLSKKIIEHFHGNQSCLCVVFEAEIIGNPEKKPGGAIQCL